MSDSHQDNFVDFLMQFKEEENLFYSQLDSFIQNNDFSSFQQHIKNRVDKQIKEGTDDSHLAYFKAYFSIFTKYLSNQENAQASDSARKIAFNETDNDAQAFSDEHMNQFIDYFVQCDFINPQAILLRCWQFAYTQKMLEIIETGIFVDEQLYDKFYDIYPKTDSSKQQVRDKEINERTQFFKLQDKTLLKIKLEKDLISSSPEDNDLSSFSRLKI